MQLVGKRNLELVDFPSCRGFWLENDQPNGACLNYLHNYVFPWYGHCTIITALTLKAASGASENCEVVGHVVCFAQITKNICEACQEHIVGSGVQPSNASNLSKTAPSK